MNIHIAIAPYGYRDEEVAHFPSTHTLFFAMQILMKREEATELRASQKNKRGANLFPILHRCDGSSGFLISLQIDY